MTGCRYAITAAAMQPAAAHHPLREFAAEFALYAGFFAAPAMLR
jgi:hypothetical protein